MIRLFIFAALASAIHAQAYRFGRVWDGEKVLTNAVIVVEKDRIKSIGVSDANAIDMTRYTAVPGLIVLLILKRPLNALAEREAALVARTVPGLPPLQTKHDPLGSTVAESHDAHATIATSNGNAFTTRLRSGARRPSRRPRP